MADIFSNDFAAQSLYLAYFGRPGDIGGFTQGRAQIATNLSPVANQSSLVSMKDAYFRGIKVGANAPDVEIVRLIKVLSNSNESQDFYGDIVANPEIFVQRVFDNAFGRDPEPEGLNFWVTEIRNGLDPAGAAVAIIAGAYESNDTQAALDRAAVNAKISYAQAFTDAMNTSEEIAAYRGQAAANAGRDFLDAIDENSQVANAAVISDLAQNALTNIVQTSTPNNYVLTDKIESISAEQTTGNSLGTAAIGTLNPGDKIFDNSTTDNDSLIAEISGVLPNSLGIQNIENIQFTVLSGTASVDALNVTGAKAIAMRGEGDLSLTNLTSVATKFTMDGTKGDLSLGFTNDSVRLANDFLDVALVRNTGGTLTVGSGIENVRLSTIAGDLSRLTSLVGPTPTVIVNGGGDLQIGDDLNLGAISDTVLRFDARNAGKTTLFAEQNELSAFLTGDSTDTLTLNTGLATGNLISMGRGIDTLVLKAASNQAANINEVENIDFTAANASLNMRATSGPVNLDFQGGGSLTLTGVTNGSSVMTSTSGETTDISIAFSELVKNDVFNLDLNQNIVSGSTLTIVNAADSTVTVGGQARFQRFGDITLDDNNTDNSDVAKKFTLEVLEAGVLVETGVFLDTDALQDLNLKATGAGSRINFTGIAPDSFGSIEAGSLQRFTSTASDLSTVTLGRTLNAGNDFQVLSVEGGFNTRSGAFFNIDNPNGVAEVNLNTLNGQIGAGNSFLRVTNTGGDIDDVQITGAGSTFLSLTSLNGEVTSVSSDSTGNDTISILNIRSPATSSVPLKSTVTLLAGNNIVKVSGVSNDVITGGRGFDIISGGDGADTINLSGGDINRDVILYKDGSLESKKANINFQIDKGSDLDRIVDLISEDRISIDFVGNASTVGSLVDFNDFNPSDPTSIALRTLTLTSVDRLDQIAGAINGLDGGGLLGLGGNPDGLAASTATAAQGVIVTVQTGDFQGTYLGINDGISTFDENDFLVSLVGTSTGLNANNFDFNFAAQDATTFA